MLKLMMVFRITCDGIGGLQIIGQRIALIHVHALIHISLTKITICNDHMQ